MTKRTFSTELFLLISFVPAAVFLAGCDTRGSEFDPQSGFGFQMAWPVSDARGPIQLASPFGPRIQSSNDDYDFHRGIDIDVPKGTKVLAAAHGEVVIAGWDSDYDDRIVQLAHCADQQPARTIDDCQTPAYTNYLHLSEVLVSEGDRVARGDLLGLSGASSAGSAHLHFEVRNGGNWQQYAVHPLSFLPYQNDSTPDLTFDYIDFGDPQLPRVKMTITLPAGELDLNRVEAEIYHGASGPLVASQNYDMNEWNAKYTTLDRPNAKLDDRFFGGITVRPYEFNTESDVYMIYFRFRQLPIEIPPEEVRVIVRAIDIDGGASQYECFPCPEK